MSTTKLRVEGDRELATSTQQPQAGRGFLSAQVGVRTERNASDVGLPERAIEAIDTEPSDGATLYKDPPDRAL